MAPYGPYTSKDLDYFGLRKAAEKLALKLNGRLRLPTPDNATPHSAIVEATIRGRKVEIDFLSHVLGVRSSQILKKLAVEIIVSLRSDDQLGKLIIPVMHPLHCMQSRIANVAKLGRRDDTALRQLEAAPIIVRAYIDEMLDVGEVQEATDTLQNLFVYLRSDIEGKAAHRNMKYDPADIFEYFSEDNRLDKRYREKNIQAMRRRLKRKGDLFARIKAKFGFE